MAGAHVRLLLAACAVAALSPLAAPTPAEASVTVTPWCDDSFRVQVAPAAARAKRSRATQRLLPGGDRVFCVAEWCTGEGTTAPSAHGPLWTEDGYAPLSGGVPLGVFVSRELNDTLVAPRGFSPLPDPSYHYLRAAGALLAEADADGRTAEVRLYFDAETRQSITTAAPEEAVRALASGFVAVAVVGHLPLDRALAAAEHLPSPLVNTTCTPGQPQALAVGQTITSGALALSRDASGHLSFTSGSSVVFNASVAFFASNLPGYSAVNLTLAAGNKRERIFGLGQGGWTVPTGCAAGTQQHVVPLQRNGQTINLHQRKFFVSIPFVYSSAGYGFLFSMPGYSSVVVGDYGVGGSVWSAEAMHELDFWVTAPKEKTAGAVYHSYADATGHAPAMRDNALLFWQSRNRYKSSAIAIDVAKRYHELKLPVGVIVIDYHNQRNDGDFIPDTQCYPDLHNLSETVRTELDGADTIFSFWPEAKTGSKEFDVLKQAGCLINADLGGLAIDPTPPACRDLMWNQFLKPRYYDKGITAFWLDETDGEGSGGGDGTHGYDTSYGPAAYASNLWVNSWISLFTDPVAALGEKQPMVLTRGVWAGGAKHGVVLWSSDIESSFRELTVQVPLGVHASLSGVPYWTSDVGGYGCGHQQPNDTPYMQELIVRWYQFGTFSPIFRTHGCRTGHADPAPPSDPCEYHLSCGYNEAWSYGAETQVILEDYIRLRATLKPYLQELFHNVSTFGTPTVRPLWWEFPEDPLAYGVNDQYLFGPAYLVAPVTAQGQTSRRIYFPKGAKWTNIFNASDVVQGGSSIEVMAPLERIPAYLRG